MKSSALENTRRVYEFDTHGPKHRNRASSSIVNKHSNNSTCLHERAQTITLHLPLKFRRAALLTQKNGSISLTHSIGIAIKPFRQICRDETVDESTGRLRRRQRENIGCLAMRKTGKLGRNSKVTPAICKMLVDLKRNLVRNQLYKAQIEHSRTSL